VEGKMAVIIKHNMILLGAAGRNSGKTLLACNLIKRYGQQFPLIAVKVTTIHRKGETCPRGGEGCGICASFEGAYCILEEKNGDLQKDTSRLLASGAWKVYWLRAVKDHLEEGMEALLRLIPEGTAVVCESNSLRTFVEPGVFLIIRTKNQKILKPSARAVLKYADRVVTFDGRELGDNPFDISLENIKLAHNRWILEETGIPSGG